MLKLYYFQLKITLLQTMKDFNDLLQSNTHEAVKLPIDRQDVVGHLEKTWWNDIKDKLIKGSGPLFITAFTGPFNTASIILQVADKPLSNSFTRKVEAAGQASKLVQTGIFGDNKIYQPFQFKGYNDCLSQLGKQGLRGLYKGALTGIILGLVNTKIRSRLYDELNKLANFSQQWKSNILTIATCTIADLVTLPLMFCQSRLAFQNSLVNFRSYNGLIDVIRKCSPIKWFSGASVLLFKNIVFSYSWMSFFQNAPVQSFVFSTFLSHILTYPFMTVIRQLQTNDIGIPMMNQRKQNVTTCIKRIYRNNGPAGFYRGFVGYGIVHSFLSFIMIETNIRSGYFREISA